MEPNGVKNTGTEPEAAGKKAFMFGPIQTGRLLIRAAEETDAEALWRIQNTDFVLYYNGMERWTLEQTQSFLEKKRGRALVVCDRGGRVLGEIGIEEDSLRYDVGSAEINYYIAEECAGQGLMREALDAVLGFLFDACGVTLVTARSFVPNTASRKLLEKLGFRLEGVLRRCVRGYGGVVFDDALYSITKEEFETKHGRA